MKPSEVVLRAIDENLEGIQDGELEIFLQFCDILMSGDIKPREYRDTPYGLANESKILDWGLTALLVALTFDEEQREKMQGSPEGALTSFALNKLYIPRKNVDKLVSMAKDLVTTEFE